MILLHRKTYAFSLTEILVVISLIVVIASLSTVALQRVRRQAQGLQNLQNHREVIRALILSASENNGTLPYCDQGTKLKLSFPRYLAQKGYLTDYRALFSPLAGSWYQERKYAYALRNPQVPTEEPWFYTNYAASRRGAMPHSLDDGGRKPARLPMVAQDGNLSKLMILLDSYRGGHDTPEANFGGGICYFSSGPQGWNYTPPQSRTFGGYVYASFADGHVERFRRETILQMRQQDATKEPFFENRYTRY